MSTERQSPVSDRLWLGEGLHELSVIGVRYCFHLGTLFALYIGVLYREHQD